MSSSSPQPSKSDPVAQETLWSPLYEGQLEAPKPAASSVISLAALPHWHSGPPESFSVPSFLGKRSRSQSPEAEYVHDLALHAAAPSSGRESAKSAKSALAKEDFAAYGPSHFGGWGEYMTRKRAKLQNQNAAMQEASLYKPQLFRGTQVYVRFRSHR
jgi:hypothetical protein